MDFNQIYVAGEHQRLRAKQRTHFSDIQDIVRNGKVVLMNSKCKYYKLQDCVMPVLKSNNENVNIIKTVLTKDMNIYEILNDEETSSIS